MPNPVRNGGIAVYLGFYDGACTRVVNANQEFSVATDVKMPATLNPNAPNTYVTTWSTWYGNTVAYSVYWVPSPNNDIFIGVANYNLRLMKGETIFTKIYVASVEDYGGRVSFQISGPRGLAISANPPTVMLTSGAVATATLKLTASSFIAEGSYAVEITDTLAHCVTCTDDISVSVG